MERIKWLRKKKNLTGEELGKLVGVQKSAISKYERGEIQPSHDVLDQIASHLNTSTDYLMGRTSDPTPPDAKQEKPLSLEELEALYMQKLIDNRVLMPGEELTAETRKRLEESIRLAIKIAIESQKG
ncbi:helix-turn-helix domain-containing protein [Oscillospiraceae bacterium MB08-C2-2]|nr:helix-turn-helix domain-containing protein [Oscillospiraceae bacterium MB08-C2-2]